jgi:hypothetical protein
MDTQKKKKNPRHVHVGHVSVVYREEYIYLFIYYFGHDQDAERTWSPHGEQKNYKKRKINGATQSSLSLLLCFDSTGNKILNGLLRDQKRYMEARNLRTTVLKLRQGCC